MNTTFIAMAIALLMGVGLLVGIGALSLLSGAFNFLFIKPKIQILKSLHGENGFAFSFSWDQEADPVSFNQIKIHLFNAFGTPTQIQITKEFDSFRNDFSIDLDLAAQGIKLKNILEAKGLSNSSISLEVSGTKDGVTHSISMSGNSFKEKLQMAKVTVGEVNEKLQKTPIKPFFKIPERSFIAPPLPKSNKVLKIATNPEFASALLPVAEVGAVVAVNFSVAKVWIEPGCIVCDACEAIYPEVFQVLEATCIVRPGAPLNDGLKIKEAAEACPVEVIKFS